MLKLINQWFVANKLASNFKISKSKPLIQIIDDCSDLLKQDTEDNFKTTREAENYMNHQVFGLNR